MDPRLRDMAEAFGRDDLARVRYLAGQVFEEASEQSLRMAVAELVIQSYLNGGDFDRARAAAAKAGEPDALAAVNRSETAYQAEVRRLQRMAAIARDPREAAEAQLRTAQAHQASGKWELADVSYRKVVARYGDLPQAGEAVVRLANMHFLADNTDAAISACVWAAAQEPNSSSLAENSTHKLADLCVAARTADRGRAALHSLAERFPGTLLHAWANYHSADLAWRTGRWEVAAEEWTQLWSGDLPARKIPLLPERLAESLYRAAYEACDRQEYEKALASYVAFADGSPSEWRRRNVSEARLTLDTADCYAGLKQWDKVLELVAQATKQQGADQQADHALYLEGCAQWGLGNWDAAVHAWQVALERYPLTEWGNKARERIRP